MAAQTERGVPLSTLSPRYLYSNSTSHIWPFSAIAELIDNAYDPDVKAKQFWIDRIMIKNDECLSFMDNGNGLDNQTMHKMLSFGYSDKTADAGIEPIGIYGNGFKSGSMRLGKDAIVFSKSKNALCVGMLSQTYLEQIKAKEIFVPIVCFEKVPNNKFSVREDHKASLRDILKYSPFKTQEELLTEINHITSPGTNTKTGTRIIIWNLRRTSSRTEFDFNTDPYDIRIPSDVVDSLSDPSQHSDRLASYIPESVYSLRAYCSILYLKPRMQVIVRGQKVTSQLIAKSLACIRRDHYKPIFLSGKSIPITFGYNTKSKDQYGIMMYHKNRLIKAYERVGCQLRGNNNGVGVIGVIECNFLEPTHNKQSFLESDKYRKTMTNLAIKLEEYWKEIRYCKSKENPGSSVRVEDTMKRPDQNWVQCDECLNWRKLPDGIDCSKLPKKWFCHMNPDPQFRSCNVPEEPEDSDDDESYRKTYKQQEKEDRKKKSKERENLAELNRQSEALRKREEQLKLQMQESSYSRRSRSPIQACTQDSEIQPIIVSAVSHGASRASSNNGLPVISSVRSLSLDLQRKRSLHPVTPQETAKKTKVEEFDTSEPTVASTSHSSPPMAAVPDQQNIDDDILILECSSTPKPPKIIPAITQVKCENMQCDEGISMLLDGVDDVPVDNPEKMENPGTVEKGTQSTCGMNQLPSGLEGGLVDQVKIKQETNTVSEESNQGLQVKQNGLSDDPESKKGSGSSSDSKFSSFYPRCTTETQGQQNKLMELMQRTAQERDDLKKEVDHLKSQLQDVQAQLLEMSQLKVKTESTHQGCQTENTDEKDFKGLFEKASRREEETANSLRELRHNIGRILISYVPALDLEQVNYECSVIDEILEQVLNDTDRTPELEQ